MAERIEWIRGQECGSGATCPKIGRMNGRLFVVGEVVHDQSLIAQSGVGPTEALLEIPPDLAPELGS